MDRNIDDKFKSIDGGKKDTLTSSSAQHMNSNEIKRFGQHSKTRNKSNIQLNKEATFDSIYLFKTNITLDKYCNPVHPYQYQESLRKPSNNTSKNYSINKALISTRDTEGFISNNKSLRSINNYKPVKNILPYRKDIECEFLDYSKMNFGETLYYKGVKIINKREKKIEKQFQDLIKGNIPLINQKSKKLFFQRDPNSFYERLYPKHKIDTFLEEYEKYPTIDDEKDLKMTILEKKIYRRKKELHKDSFDFQPYISIRSKSLALNKGPSIKRILSNKKIIADKDQDPLIGKLTYFLCNPKPKEKKNYSSSKSSMYLFDQAEILKRKKDEKIKKKKMVEENEMKEILTFKPDISKSSKKTSNQISKHSKKESFDKRQERWNKCITSKKDKIKEYFVNLEMEDCTFKPNVQPLNLPDDDKFIQKNLSQIINYVNQRQNALEKDSIQKLYEEKKFLTSRNYLIKPTICKEFELRTNKLNRSLNAHNRYKLNNNEIRNKINWQNFFSEKISLTDYGNNENFNNNSIEKQIIEKKQKKKLEKLNKYINV